MTTTRRKPGRTPTCRPSSRLSWRHRTATLSARLAAHGAVFVPDRYRVGHEAHFAQVTRSFLGYLKAPASLPKWERPNMLAKYYVTTKAVELSRHEAARP